MPTCVRSRNSNSIDWHNRSLFPADEVVTVTGHDESGHSRKWNVAWGDIDGDIANTSYGRLHIQEVTQDADRPKLEEELVPCLPRTVRHPLSVPLISPPFLGDTNRWRTQMERHLGRSTREQSADDLAQELGVLPQVLLDLELHHDSEESEWLIPERDSYGGICGLAVRYWYPWRDERDKQVTKGFRPGGRRGLYYLDGWWDSDGPILSPEGFSDTATCLSMGITTIGRSSAKGGGDQLLFLFSEYHTSEDLIIIADRDGHDSGVNVGLDGARKTATVLAAGLSRPIQVAFPPDGCKDIREWFQGYCDGDLSPERLAAAREVFLEHVLSTAQTIQPGRHYELQVDVCEILSPEEWRAAMHDARIASVTRAAHYADFSPTGAGKSYADRALVLTALDNNKTVLLVVPTHVNCEEEVRRLSEANIDAVAYPQLSPTTCQRYREASSAVNQGLDLVRSVCSGCRHMHDKSCMYRQQIERANNSPIAVCTTARLGHDPEVSRRRDVISVHEVADTAICGQYALSRSEIEQARRVLQIISNSRREPRIRTDAALSRTEETREYLRGLVSLCDVMLESLRTGTRPTACHSIDLPPGYWAKLVNEWLTENVPGDDFFQECEDSGFAWGDDRIDGDTLRGLTVAAQGASWDVMTWPVETPQGRRIEHRVMVQCRLQFCDHQTWWWQDATGDREQLRCLIGRDVVDMTPEGRLEQRQEVDVVPIDITRKTAASKVVDAIRMQIMTTDCSRLGVIGHKIHIDQLAADDGDLIAPEIRDRIHMMSYYGAGLGRGSNQWLECDRLLILGTPRIGDDAIRQELWRSGQREAARICEPGWVQYTWEARVAESDDQTVFVSGMSYSNPAWHEACLRITRAAMRQALGRARVILEYGVPATIWTTEHLSEYPVRDALQLHTAVIDAVQTLWIADRNPAAQPVQRGVRVEEDGRVWLTGAEIARRLRRERNWASPILAAAESQGLVERARRRQGWSLAGGLRAA